MCAKRQHLGLYELVDLLMSMNCKMEHAIRDHLAKGAIPPKRLRKDRDREDRIRHLLSLYTSGNMDVDDFLYGIQSNIYMN